MARPITLVSGQWADLPFDVFCQKARHMGYDGIELAAWGNHLNLQKAATDTSYVKSIEDTLKKYNLGCWAIATHLPGQVVGDCDTKDVRISTFAPDSCAGDFDKMREWGIKEMKMLAIATKNLGVKITTSFMGSSIWHAWYSFPPTTEDMIEKAYKRIYELWSPIFDEFDKVGLRFALEVHPSEIAYDYYSTKRLMDTFKNRDTLGINFDPSHLIWQGVDPKLFFRDFAEKIYHVHMKDTKVNLDGRASILGSHLPFGDLRRGWNFVSLGHGDVNFDAIVREANSANYEGPFSIEWEDNGMDREFGAKEACDYLKRLNFGSSNVAFDGSMEN